MSSGIKQHQHQHHHHHHHYHSQFVRVQFLHVSKIILLLTIIWILSFLLKNLFELKTLDPSDYKLSSTFNDHRAPPELLNWKTTHSIDNESTLAQKQDHSIRFSSGIGIDNNGSACTSHFDECDENNFHIYVHSGNENKLFPVVCIDGKRILGEKLNGCGRGFNVIVIDNITKTVIRILNFDTYEKDSIELETMILTLRKGDIAIFITFDESVTKLSYVAKLLLHEIGSALIQNIQYRSTWFMISQKGIDGYTPYEELHLGGEGTWGAPVQFTGCVPYKMTGIPVRPDQPLVRNPKRVEFCKKYSKLWTLFCDERIVNEPLVPSKILGHLSISPQASRTPIIILTGKEHNENVALSLETIVRQAGLVPSNVIVFYDPLCCTPIKELAELFGFMSQRIDYNVDNLLVNIQLTVKSIFRDAKQLIIIDCNVLLAADLYSFFGQLLPLLNYPNSSLVAISAHNENSLINVTENNKVVFRANLNNYSPRLAIMVKRDFLLKSSTNDSIFWSFSSPHLVHSNKSQALAGSTADLLLPEVSRAYFMAPANFMNLTGPLKDTIMDYLDNNIHVNLEPEVALDGLNDLITSETYRRKLVALIHESNQYTNLAAFVESESLEVLRKSVTLVCQETSQCEIFCSYLGVQNCAAHLNVPGVGDVLRVTQKSATKGIFIVKR